MKYIKVHEYCTLPVPYTRWAPGAASYRANYLPSVSSVRCLRYPSKLAVRRTVPPVGFVGKYLQQIFAVLAALGSCQDLIAPKDHQPRVPQIALSFALKFMYRYQRAGCKSRDLAMAGYFGIHCVVPLRSRCRLDSSRLTDNESFGLSDHLP